MPPRCGCSRCCARRCLTCRTCCARTPRSTPACWRSPPLPVAGRVAGAARPAPLRLPRPVLPVGAGSRCRAAGAANRRAQRAGDPSGRWLLGVRGTRRAQPGHLHGFHAAGGRAHVEALGQRRPRDAAVAAAQWNRPRQPRTRSQQRVRTAGPVRWEVGRLARAGRRCGARPGSGAAAARVRPPRTPRARRRGDVAGPARRAGVHRRDRLGPTRGPRKCRGRPAPARRSARADRRNGR